METEVVRSAIGALIRARHAFQDALDPGCTLIAIDLLLAVGRTAQFDRRTQGAPGPTVKELFGQIPHSNRGARIHFNRLVAEGYLRVEPGDHDRRTRIVKLTPKGEQVLRKASAALVQTLGSSRPHGEAPFRSLALRRAAQPPADAQISVAPPPSASS